MNHHFFHRRQLLRRTGTLGVGALLGQEVFAAVFMEVAQALKQLFPQAEQFLPVAVGLDDSKLARIASLSETRMPRQFAPRVWQAVALGRSLGWITVDRVIGKFDWIDFAVGFSCEGDVVGVEIMAYRESHGAEIRQPAWRKQFNGRKGPQAMRFADDIRNISGATLSCQHVTEGIQRLSALVALLKSDK